MQRYNRLLNIFLVSVLMAVGMTACVDDDLIFRQSVMPHGEAVVNIEAAFEPFTEQAMGSRANYYPAPNGDGMKDVSDVVLLAYDVNGDLLDGFPMELTDYKVEDEKRTDDDTSSNDHPTAETSTKCIKKTIKLFYGDYYLVAVANMGEYTAGADGGIGIKTSTMQTLAAMDSSEYNTLDALRKIRRKWDTGSYRNNREMCGYFFDKANPPSNPNASSDFETVHVDSEGMTLRTWLRRLASKVTVDFDGTDLRENVKIYIRDVKIYDLASTCTLGFGKRPGADEQHYINYNNSVGSDDDADKGTHSKMLHEGSHVINFYNRYNTGASDNDDSHQYWPRISKGSPYIYVDPAADNKVKADLHANNAPSLFFYENMQGDAPNGKGPITDLVHGGVANKDSVKENMPYGTYIEVTAYYESEASNNISNGPIKYRFMLGKDAVKNCDAERNYHYKVTLKFNGNANEYSWHIDYKEEPDSWDVPQPWYVSYLYNHQSTIPFKYTPPEGFEVVYFDAEITDNPWQPDEDSGISLPPDNAEALAGDNKSIGNGFLSLRKTNQPVVTPQMCGAGTDGTEWKVNYSDDNMKQLNLDYFTGASSIPEQYRLDRSERKFYVDGRDDPDNKGDEKYSYQRRGNSVSLNMPLYTRAKVLIKQSGYSGNNPYVGYTRTATVRITPYMRKIGSKDTPAKMEGKFKDVKVQQVRRIVNPKGVYRRSGNNQDFNVHLLELPGDGASDFRDFTSDGPWMAEILGDKNFITLDGKQTVSGSTGSSITFNIRFNKLNSGNTVRNAVVRVLYNSYTCTHLIFVRQGYDPQEITDNAKDFDHQNGGVMGVKWRTFNRLSKTKDVDDPRDEGSLFKYGNNYEPIHPFNNCYKDKDANGKYDGIGDYRAPVIGDASYQTSFDKSNDNASAGSYYLTNDNGSKAGSRTPWGNVYMNNNGFPDTDGWNKIATMRHFEQLYTSANMQFGFGVLYADGATSTQTAVNDAYGYYRDDPDRAKKGMRGIFVYYWDEYNPQYPYTGRNVFFPIGRSGYGHRKQGVYTSWNKSYTEYPTGKGILRYSCSGYKSRSSTFQHSAPLFSALYYRPGAIYYAKKSVSEDKYLDWTGNPSKDGAACGMDMNYFSFDVNMIGIGNLAGGEDACMVRFVE